ncbi:MAG: hypothetical protein C0412_17070 [Flavobacterium sp.]|nr:hypothetical protein [Flavobacterium sp.]
MCSKKDTLLKALKDALLKDGMAKKELTEMLLKPDGELEALKLLLVHAYLDGLVEGKKLGCIQML